MNLRPAKWFPIINRIQRIMRSDSVDAADRRLALLLGGCAAVFGVGVRLRAAAYRHGILHRRKLPCRVISVGNLAVGGTGKTPTALYIAAEVQKMGYRTVLISRGYHGRAEKAGGIVSDGRRLQMDAAGAGDEPFMLAMLLQRHRVPVVVGRDRFAAGTLALQHFRPAVIVLDDGFQHLRLERDVDLVLLDGDNPLGNRHLLPRGFLREPPQALRRCHALILTTASGRSDDSASRQLKRTAPDLPVFRAAARPYVHAIREAGGKTVTADDTHRGTLAVPEGASVFGFSGIARNDRFRTTLQDTVGRLQGFLDFPDHHDYSAEDLRRIRRAAASVGAHWLVTTVKDYVRIEGRLPADIGIIVLGAAMDFGRQADEFRQFLTHRLE